MLCSRCSKCSGWAPPQPCSALSLQSQGLRYGVGSSPNKVFLVETAREVPASAAGCGFCSDFGGRWPEVCCHTGPGPGFPRSKRGLGNGLLGQDGFVSAWPRAKRRFAASSAGITCRTLVVAPTRRRRTRNTFTFPGRVVTRTFRRMAIFAPAPAELPRPSQCSSACPHRTPRNLRFLRALKLVIPAEFAAALPPTLP